MTLDSLERDAMRVRASSTLDFLLDSREVLERLPDLIVPETLLEVARALAAGTTRRRRSWGRSTVRRRRRAVSVADGS